MASSSIETKVENLLTSIITNLGYELYDVLYEKEGKEYYLRIIIDKPEGISIDDCEIVNNAINDILDEADYIKDQYYLEVSSPGLERVLRKEKHFLSQMGNEISVKLFKPIDKQKELIGILKEYNSKELTLEIEDLAKKNTKKKVKNPEENAINQGWKELKIETNNIAIVKTIFNW